MSDSPGTIVVTRFSIPWKGRIPDIEWVDARFDLLERVAFPSMVRQQVDGLLWVVVTARSLRPYVASLFSQLSLPGGDIVVAMLGHELKAVADFFPDVDRFLTARLDSDDAFMPSALSTAIESCRALEDREPALVNFGAGYQLDWNTGGVYPIRFRADRQGPFLAVTNDGRDTMLHVGGQHAKAREGRKLIVVPDPQWIQVVHGENVINRIPGDHGCLPDAEAAAVLAASGIRR